jgi:hypothetical protein
VQSASVWREELLALIVPLLRAIGLALGVPAGLLIGALIMGHAPSFIANTSFMSVRYFGIIQLGMLAGCIAFLTRKDDLQAGYDILSIISATVCACSNRVLLRVKTKTMDLKSLHQYLGQLLETGLDPSISVCALDDEWPREIHDVELLDGGYHGDMAPKLNIGRLNGPILVFLPIGGDMGTLLSASAAGPATHRRIDLPVEPPYKA